MLTHKHVSIPLAVLVVLASLISISPVKASSSVEAPPYDDKWTLTSGSNYPYADADLSTGRLVVWTLPLSEETATAQVKTWKRVWCPENLIISYSWKIKGAFTCGLYAWLVGIDLYIFIEESLNEGTINETTLFHRYKDLQWDYYEEVDESSPPEILLFSIPEAGYYNVGVGLAGMAGSTAPAAFANVDFMVGDGDGAWVSMEIESNFPPDTPSTPSGFTGYGYQYRTYEFSTSTTDPEGDLIQYQFWWDDTTTTTTGWYTSGVTVTASHSWGYLGTYWVKVRARDFLNDWGDWSPSLKVEIIAGGGGSCPFIYSWDGQQYRFDHEAYPFAVIKSAETTSYDRLKYLKEVDGEYRLRIEQVLHEVAWLDSFDLYVVDHPNNDSFVMPDLEGNLHTVKEPIQPVSAYEKNGEDCLEDIKYFDYRIWQDSVLDANVSDESTLRNWITLTFPKPEATTAKLLLNVKKQETITKEWEFFINVIGENYWNLWQKIMEAPILTELFSDTLGREIELSIEVWNGAEWTKQGSISAGDSIWDDFLVVLDISDIQGDQLQIRLKSTTGHYQINYVGIDYSEDEPMTIHKIDPYSAIKNGEENISGTLEYPDETYVTLTPNDVIELKYNAIPETEWKRDYTIATKGYYNFIDFQNRTFTEFLQGTALWLKAMTEPYFVPKTVFPYLQENQ